MPAVGNCTAANWGSLVKHLPRPRTAALVLLAHLVVFNGIWMANGIKYNHIGDSAGAIFKWYVAPLAGAPSGGAAAIGWLSACQW